jgi:sarcosine oxidase
LSAKENPDLLVVGLGAMGSAVAYHAAKRGMCVLGIDRFAPPHVMGSTHGQSRITREAIGEGEQFVPLARRSHMLWRTLEEETGTALLHACGGLVLSRRGTASRMHAQDDFFGNTVRAAQRFGIAHELLDATEIRERFPRFAVSDDEQGYFEPGAGWLDPEACVSTHLNRARALGAQLRLDEKIERIEVRTNGIEVVCGNESFRPARLVVAAGAWLPGLLPGFAPGRLVVRRQVMHWFEDRTPSENEPVFIWHWGAGEDAVFYGFPGREGALKMAAEQLAGRDDPDQVNRIVAPEESAAFHAHHAEGRMQGVGARCVRSATCLYTVAPRANFVIDSLPENANAIAVSACSGHGFKHSAAIGEAVAAWVQTGERPEVLVPFARSNALAD